MDHNEFRHVSMLPWSGDHQTRVHSTTDLFSHPRKQALDLAEQAQVAACSYFGFDPQEMRCNLHYLEKGFTPALLRPVELHLHHHHHHHLDGPYGVSLSSVAGRAENAYGHTLAGRVGNAYGHTLLTGREESDDGLVQKAVQTILWQKDQTCESNESESYKLKPTPAAQLEHINVSGVENAHLGNDYQAAIQSSYRQFTEGVPGPKIDFYVPQQPVYGSGAEEEHQIERHRHGLLSTFKLDFENSWDDSIRSTNRSVKSLMKETTNINKNLFSCPSMSNEGDDTYNKPSSNSGKRVGPSINKRKKFSHSKSEDTEITSIRHSENDLVFNTERHGLERLGTPLQQPLELGPEFDSTSISTSNLELEQTRLFVNESITGHNFEEVNIEGGSLLSIKEKGLSSVSRSDDISPKTSPAHLMNKSPNQPSKKDLKLRNNGNTTVLTELSNYEAEETGGRVLFLEKVNMNFKGDQTTKKKESTLSMTTTCKVEKVSLCSSLNKKIVDRLNSGDNLLHQNGNGSLVPENLSVDGWVHNIELGAYAKPQEGPQSMQQSPTVLKDNEKVCAWLTIFPNKEQASYKEELEEANSERIRLQKLLEMEKLTHETYKKELQEVKCKFEKLATSSSFSQDDFLQVNSMQDQGVLKLPFEDGKSTGRNSNAANDSVKLMNVAEENFWMLLHERERFLNKFAELLEQGNKDVLLELIQVERVNQGRILGKFKQLKQMATVLVKESKTVRKSHHGVEKEPQKSVQRSAFQENSLEGLYTKTPGLQVNDDNAAIETSIISAGKVGPQSNEMATQTGADLTNVVQLSSNFFVPQKMGGAMLERGYRMPISREKEYNPQADPANSTFSFVSDEVCYQNDLKGASADLVAMTCCGTKGVLHPNSRIESQNVQKRVVTLTKSEIYMPSNELSTSSNPIQHPASEKAEVTIEGEISEVTSGKKKLHGKQEREATELVIGNSNQPKIGRDTIQEAVDDMEIETTSNANDNQPKASSWLPGGYSTVYVSPIFEDTNHLGCLNLKQQIGGSDDMQKHEPEGSVEEIDSKQAMDSKMEVQKEVCHAMEKCSIGLEEHGHKVIQSGTAAVIAEFEWLRKSTEAARTKIAEERCVNKMNEDKMEADDKSLITIQQDCAQQVQIKEGKLVERQEKYVQVKNDISIGEKALEELQAKHRDLEASLQMQLATSHSKVKDLQSTVADLRDQLVRSSSSISLLEALQEKDAEILQVRRRMQLTQEELDSISIEKFDLFRKVEELRKEEKEQKQRIDELMAINEELLAFAEGKENEVTLLTKQVSLLHQKSEERVLSNNKIRVPAEITKIKETDDEADSFTVLERHYQSKLKQAQSELLQREEAMELQALHLASVIEGHDSVLHEIEKLHATLHIVQHKEHIQDDQIKHSNAIIKNLEDKLREIEAECLRGKIQMAETRAQNSAMQKAIEGKELEADELKRDSQRMRWRVQQLEEEMMEKEGQIAILKSSFHGEYECAF